MIEHRLDQRLDRADQHLQDLDDLAEWEKAQALAEIIAPVFFMQLKPHCECGGDMTYHLTFEGFTVDIPGGRCVDCGVSG